MSDHERDDDGGNLILDRPPTEDRERVEPPPKYAVLFLNDDFTPMDFVVALLTKFFDKSQEQAEAIMLEVHEQGEGLAGTYPKDIAETKAIQVCTIARDNEHPFRAVARALH